MDAAPSRQPYPAEDMHEICLNKSHCKAKDPSLSNHVAPLRRRLNGRGDILMIQVEAI